MSPPTRPTEMAPAMVVTPCKIIALSMLPVNNRLAIVIAAENIMILKASSKATTPSKVVVSGPLARSSWMTAIVAAGAVATEIPPRIRMTEMNVFLFSLMKGGSKSPAI